MSGINWHENRRQLDASGRFAFDFEIISNGKISKNGDIIKMIFYYNK